MLTYIRNSIFAFLLAFCFISMHGQTVENRPYCDLRPVHFGVIIGTHMQDLSMHNVVAQPVVSEDGTVTEGVITSDQDRWDNGFHVGVLAEARINDYIAFRTAPQLYFGNRHLTFRNFSLPDANGKPTEIHQDMKSVYVACSLDLIYAAKRHGNHRPYLMAGLSPAINLSTKASEAIQLKRTDLFCEAGIGCDYYLPFFKLRPELKFMFSMGNSLNKDHAKSLRDPNLVLYANSVNKASTKMVTLTFYFE